MKKIIPLLLFLLIATAADWQDKKSNSKNTPASEEKTQAQKMDCYKNIHEFNDNSSMKDIEELNLWIDGEKVSGEYNWLPAQKDQRKGSLTGTIENNTVNAQYTFVQEGKKDTATLKITLRKNEAIIKGGAPASGLNTTLKKISCDEE